MRCFVLISGMILCGATVATAATYVVNPEGTGDFPTIQEAIDACNDGDIVELTDGTFTGDGNRDIDYLGKAISIRSQSGNAEGCIIDCERQARGFVGGMPGSLEGITVTRGQGVEFGGAILIVSGSLAVHKCIFSDNHAPSNGGAIFIDMCSRITFSECSFVRNVSGAGGAICT